MFQVQLINSVVTWEWQLKIEKEKQRNLKGEPDRDFIMAPQPHSKDLQSVLRQISQHGRPNQSTQSYCACD